jgi:hypothetical protein
LSLSDFLAAAEKQILSLKPALRLEQIGDEHSERGQEVPGLSFRGSL